MNKTQRINYQSDLIESLNVIIGRQDDEVAQLRKERSEGIKARAKALDADLANAAYAKKAATEAATLKSIKDGFVPIEVLRDLTGAEYTTEHCQSFTKTDLTVMLNAAKPVDKAILAALLEKPKDALGYATGGYTGVRVGDKVGLISPQANLHYNPSIITGGVVA